MDINFEEINEVLKEEKNLVKPNDPGRIVFVGDTHGDLQASRRVFSKYFDDRTTLVFLGDYVDRGPKSEENINFLLDHKLKDPDRVVLLQGNHEGMKFKDFGPVDFWNSLRPEKRKLYSNLLSQLPLALTWNGIIATHGGLPDLRIEDEINEIDGGDSNWGKITWGDLNEVEGYILGGGFGRPQLGTDYFDQVMESFEKNVLVRSHQPNVPTFMFDKRCITIFTSSAYGAKRRVAIAEGKVDSGDDLSIEEI